VIRVDRVPLVRPDLGDAEIEAAGRVIRSGWLTPGAEVAAFEEEFRTAVGAAHAVAVSSGTVALELALRALGVGAGDDVATVSHSFIATANAVVAAGARPVFVDIEPDTLAAVDHRAARRVVSLLLQRERRAQHVARQAFPAFGVVGGNAHLVVDGEAAMAPGEHLLSKRRKDHRSSDKETEHLAAQPLGKNRFRDRRQRNETSRRFEDAVGNERVHLGVEVDQIPRRSGRRG
jgi:hypothetical protein